MTERKRCAWVHDSLYIKDNGDVFPCCHLQPGVVGNIYRTSLKAIYNGDKLKEFRQQEIDGTLGCMKTCNLWQVSTVEPALEHDYDQDLKRVMFSFGEKCNIRCIMCSQNHDSRIELTEEIILENVEIPKSRPIVTLLGGEPLVLKSAKRFIDHWAGHGAKMTILTNGTALSEEMARKVALSCSIISFSLNAATKKIHEIVNVGSRFDKVIRNIQRMIEAKRETKAKIVIMGHMTIVVENVHEIPAFIGKKDEFGFEMINFGYDRKVPPYLAQNPELKAGLIRDIQVELAKARNPSRIELHRLRLLGLIAPPEASVPPTAAAPALQEV
ncbi:MAG: radical SAM protein [Methylocystis sp.]|uniref:radical SAM protein n=1 Tax=Methylocystis sp. TaxID=1911079 RepID=UPI003934C493